MKQLNNNNAIWGQLDKPKTSNNKITYHGNYYTFEDIDTNQFTDEVLVWHKPEFSKEEWRYGLYGIKNCENSNYVEEGIIIIKPQKKEFCICFFGLCKTTNYCIESIKGNIFNILKSNNINYKIFLHTYNDISEITNKRNNEYNMKFNSNNYKLLKPDKYLLTKQTDFTKNININDYKHFGDPWPNNPNTSLLNYICALYSLKLSFNLLDKKYKCIIFMRPDLKYFDKINIDILNEVYHSNKPIFYTNDWGLCNGYNDRFYICNYLSALHIANRYDNILYYSQTINRLHAETYLKYIIGINNIIVKFFNYKVFRVINDNKYNKNDIYLYENKLLSFGNLKDFWDSFPI